MPLSIVKELSSLYPIPRTGGIRSYGYDILFAGRKLVELTGLEPATSGVQNRRSPN